ncbi:MAG: RagB/SusD family nutrient uptake outer membrane protein [Chitinophagaceae bacterium]|nr:RagB/SusD family nutrient uptake outer membrane protein [Chitinophagaceae bacterium]
MTKIFKYLAMLFAVALLLPACKKTEVIELAPEFSLDALNNPSNIDQVEQVLAGTYSGFRNGNYYGSGSGTGAGWTMMPDVMSDNLYETLESLANSRAMADFTFTTNTGQVNTFWGAPYSVIAGANLVLRDIDKFTNANTQLRANRLKGQAYIIRALAHFDLFRYFAVKYDRASTTDLAIPYSKEFVVSVEAKPTRPTNKEFYDNLFDDISKGIALLQNIDKPINSSSALTRPYLDLTAAYALQARVNLYAGDFATAETAASNAIAARPLVNLNQAAFSGMYNQTSSGEIIWNVQFESGQSGPTFLVFFATNNRSYFRPALEIATTSGTSGLIRNNDIRYSAYFSTIGGGLAVTKYKGKNGVSDGNANAIPFRTGEMYLIRAEARARQGGAKEALGMADLNALRAARINGYVPEALTGTALLTAIADERRRELVAEGHRFFDLKRTTRTITRGSTCGNTALSSAGTCSLSATAREWALPIPELVRNANGNLTQNPGY